ncbi:MAG TPA: CheR family methyltransferase [Burkholderiaceae bacterium]|nr:CheR family methyltransferase [Burkholderiaceae bacterium]
MQISEATFAAVADLFHRESGIRFGPDKKILVAGRLSRLAIESGATSIEEYVAALARSRDPEMLTRIVDRLTTNETYFFREPRHFDHLATVAAAARGRRAVRVWSAASSSGEEAYSAAMVLADVMGLQGWEVVGTDLSSAMVLAAQLGLYPLERAAGIPARYLERFCRKGSGPYEGQMLVGRELRVIVQFARGNLLQPQPALGLFDVIFLRNVLIYFDTARKAQIVANVVAHLAPGGVLYVGHAETLRGLPGAAGELRQAQPAIYQREE